MPHWRCTICHHEWDGSEYRSSCDLCNGPGCILEQETSFDEFVRTKGWEDLLRKIDTRRAKDL